MQAKVVTPKEMKATTSALAWEILRLIAKKPSYPKELSRKLNTHEQKVYYHINNLRRAGLIKVVEERRIHGAVTKFYSLKQPAVALVFNHSDNGES